MKNLFLLIIQLLLSVTLFSQQTLENDSRCIEKCHHSWQFSRNQQVAYYQYTSMEKYDLKYLKLDIEAETGSRDICGSAFILHWPYQHWIHLLQNSGTI